MKAKEVLRRYAAGERNFQRVNLRGQSFKGQDLSGADFSEADIRGTNFKNANLQGVNFTGAKAGLQKRWVTFLLVISLFVSGIAGFCSFIMAFFVSMESSNPIHSNNFYIGLFCLICLVIVLIISFLKGLGAGAGAVAAVVFVAIATLFFVEFSSLAAFGTIFTVVVAVVVAVAVAVAFAGAVAVAFVGAVAVAVAVIFILTSTVITIFVTPATATFVFPSVFTLFGLYLGWRLFKGDERDPWVRSFAVAFAATGGTNFQGANLTHAIFTSATLKNTDFRKAIITRTCFRNAKKLDLARPGKTYLKNLKLQKWLTGTGKDNNFDREDLRGVNFQGNILTDASFISADLSEANLQDADLSRAKLVQTQLDKTDFTGATLTGAFIEDWNITVNTKLRGVRCDYIYLRLPTKEDPDPHRKPDNRNEIFADGDFEDFIKPIFDTLDLYHNQNVDPRAISLAWKKLAENNPDAELEIVAMEKRGQDKFLLRAKTAPEADKSQLNAEYFQEYYQLKAISEADKKLLAEKDNRIQKLENMVMTAIQSPKFHIEGETDMNYGQSRTQNFTNSTINNSGAGAFSLGDINGTVANTINQLPSSSDANETEIKELLTQLQQAIDDPNLSEDDQKQTLEQIKTLSEAGQNPKDETMQKKAKKAVGFLKVIAEGIEPATQLAQACGKVLPKILLFFGL